MRARVLRREAGSSRAHPRRFVPELAANGMLYSSRFRACPSSLESEALRGACSSVCRRCYVFPSRAT
ncbi:hypothetical protein P3T40_006255 [Paraburkholderia sp. EB58]|jgi:hypothetical protein